MLENLGDIRVGLMQLRLHIGLPDEAARLIHIALT